MDTPPRQALVLASRSPQRRALLAQLGIAFTVCEVEVEELRAGDPATVAQENARRKAAAGAAAGRPDELVLGVDTLVALGGRIYGKPADETAARTTLRALSGLRHEVISGLATVRGDLIQMRVVSTAVSFRALDAATLDWYVGTGEWRDRAGGYAVQGRGAALVAGIEGDYPNVVGLPLGTLLDMHPGLLGVPDAG